MNQVEISIVPEEPILEKLLAVAKGFDTFCILNSNDFYNSIAKHAAPLYHDFDIVAAFGALKVCKPETSEQNDFFELLHQFHQVENSPLFGYFSYDLKNQIEKLNSDNQDNIGLPEAYFFIPEYIIWIKENKAVIQSFTELLPMDFYQNLMRQEWEHKQAEHHSNSELCSRFSKEEYIQTVEALRNEIIAGEVYEISFCQEFFIENILISPTELYLDLMKISPNPFSAFLKMEGKYIICSSMERFLKKEGNKLVSQPIKGTIRKSVNPEEDQILIQTLKNDEKERAENVMIVDLVRNDLAKSSKPGSVKVEELFGIYPFSQVHQMISTISSELRPEVPWTEAIKNAFPMGSMTGAPKISAMKLLEQFERSKRGVFSGAIGYINEVGDFDFNVVIRTLIYHSHAQYLSVHVGSAITYDSIPEKEFEECMVKISGIKKALKIS